VRGLGIELIRNHASDVVGLENRHARQSNGLLEAAR
jgi:hypothetical protein